MTRDNPRNHALPTLPHTMAPGSNPGSGTQVRPANGHLPGPGGLQADSNPLSAGVQRAAILSPDSRYRYSLERWWDTGSGAVLFAMLNPSTADASVDDPTIRRCMGFARSWGYEGMVVWNLYAYRATDPAELDQVGEPIGHENEDHLWRIFPDVDLIVAAWGARPNRGRYVNRERMMLVGPFYDRDLYCLGLTKDGHPRHPLRLRGDLRPILWQPVGSDEPTTNQRGNRPLQPQED